MHHSSQSDNKQIYSNPCKYYIYKGFFNQNKKTLLPYGSECQSDKRSTLANIEAERRNIKANDLKTLKVLFNVSYEKIFYN